MKKIYLTEGIAIILLIGTVLLITANGRSDNSGQNYRGVERNGPPPCPLLTALDTDTDTIISVSEIQNAATVLLKLDKNQDGQLTEDELRPEDDGNGMRPPHGDHQPPPSPVFLALDSNSDRVIDSDEIKNAGSVLVGLDRNSDGKLSGDELHPMGRRGPRGRK